MNDRIGVYLTDAKTVAIAGHTSPDGDCVGSCLALYNYILRNYPDREVDVYLEKIPDAYRVIQNTDCVKNDCSQDVTYDVFFALDASDRGRLAKAEKYFKTAKRTVCIDHHISNEGYADVNIIEPASSSASEVLAGLLDLEEIDRDIAEALYIGIICDTACFRHPSTGEETMRLAGRLMSKGVRFPELIDQVFNQKTYIQNQLLGRCLIESFLMFDGKCIISVADHKTLEFYQADSSDLEGVIDQMRVTKGVEVAVLLKQTQELNYRVSLRSNQYVDVAEIASHFGGGGHKRAAGCSMSGTKYDVINNLTVYIEEQLNLS